MSILRLASPAAAGGRTARRWTHLGASALVLAAIPLTAPVAPPAVADDCPVAEVIFARGTDEPAGMGRVGDAMVDALREQTGGLDIRTYAVNYKATITQRHSGEGAKDAINHIKATVDSCPDTKIVLGGYSQGASVVNIVAGFDGVNWGDPLPAKYNDHVVAVATFGNVANRTGGPTNTQNSPLASKSIDLCNPSDPICHEGSGNSWSGHTDGYIPVYTDQAATYIANVLLTHSTPQDHVASPNQGGLQMPSGTQTPSTQGGLQTPSTQGGLQLPSVPTG
ncbi:MAG: cutinase family protein [Mycobacterium sp.]|nr:cutinase family protein [Mycobacterium sp.]